MGIPISSTFSSSGRVDGPGWLLDETPSSPAAPFCKSLILQMNWLRRAPEFITLCRCNTAVFVSTICSRLAFSLMISNFGMVSLQTLSPRRNRELRSLQAPISLGWIFQTGPTPS